MFLEKGDSNENGVRSLVKEIILGTVQLGLPYGINNGVMPARSYSIELLESAYETGVRFLDTARGYGEALEVIGDYHRKNPSKKFHVFSKFMLEDIKTNFSELIKEQKNILNLNVLQGLYFHRFNEYESSTNLIQECKLRHADVSQVGVSLYSADEFKSAIRDTQIDIMQIPISLFHHHSPINQVLKSLNKSDSKKIYARSIFLQGLLFMPHEKITGKLAPFLKVRLFLENVSKDLGLNLAEMAACYVMDLENVDGVLFGAEKIDQVNETFKILRSRNLDWENILKEMPKIDEQLLNPGNWK